MAENSLHTNTPLSKAIFQFFRHLEKDISKITSKPGSVKAYIFGGCAFHIHTNARGSNDIDVEFSSAKWLTSHDIVISRPLVTYKSGLDQRTLAWDRNFTPMLGPVHEDYQEDAIQLQPRASHSPLWIYIVTSEDLAVSKLGRYGHQDREDILTLLKLGRITVDGFYDRAKEALKYYVGDCSATTGCLNHVIKLHKQRRN